MMPAAPPPETQPVTLECVVAVSQRYRVPIEIIAGILAQEHGQLGQKMPNRNGTYDMGPMQVNSFWLPFRPLPRTRPLPPRPLAPPSPPLSPGKY